MTLIQEKKLQSLFDKCVDGWNEHLNTDFEDDYISKKQSLIANAEDLEFWYSEEFANKYIKDFMLMTNDDQPQVADIDPMSWYKVAKAKIENNKVIITDYI